MMKLDKKWWIGNLYSLLIAGTTGLITQFGLEHTRFPDNIVSISIAGWLMPASLLLFDVLSRILASPGRRRIAERLTQWSTLAVIPFIIFGFTWSRFESWLVIYALLIWSYVVVRTAMILASRQTDRNPRGLKIGDGIAVGSAVILLNVWSGPVNGFYGLLQAMGNGALTALIAILCGYIAGCYAKKNFEGTVWQRIFILLLVVSPPLLANSKSVSVYHLLSACLLVFFASYKRSDQISLILSLTASAVFLVASPIVFPGGVVATVWLCAVMLIWHRKTGKIEGFLLPGGVVVLFLTGFLVAGLKWKGLFPPGNLIQTFPGGTDWLAPLLDRSYGLLPSAPWFILCLAGWVSNIGRKSYLETAVWIGFPIVLGGLTASQWISCGEPPDWAQWMMMMPLIVPYFGVLWSDRSSTCREAVARVLMATGFIVSAGLFVSRSVFHTETVGLEDLLREFSAGTGMILITLFPHFHHNIPGCSGSVFIWLILAAMAITIVILSTRIKCGSIGRSGLVEMILASVIVSGIGLALKHTRIWVSLPVEQEVRIEPGGEWMRPVSPSQEIQAVKLLTNLSRSTHVPQGQPVAEVSFEMTDGQVITKLIEAGVHTAEWAYNRSDVLATIAHRRPTIASSWIVEEPDGQVFPGLVYQCMIFLEAPAEITGIRILNLDQNPGGYILAVKGIGLMLKTDSNLLHAPISLVQDQPIKLNSSHSGYTFELPGDTAYREIYLDSALAGAAEIKDGSPVGQLVIRSREGMEKMWIVKAGSDTAEWAAERPDMIGRVAHHIPRIAFSERRQYISTPFLGHVYRSHWEWSPDLSVASVAVEFTARDATHSEWVIYNIVLR